VAEKFDAIIVGAGPAGLSAAYILAKSGLKVIIFERGDYPGAKNVMGGVLYRQPTEEIFPEFWKTAPLERPIVQQGMWVLARESAVTASHRNQVFAREPYNCFTVLRARFDKWLAKQVTDAGALLVPETVVEEAIKNDEGQVIGVRVGRAEGEVHAEAVIAADGVNSLLAKSLGLHKEWKPNEVSVAVKEIISLPKEKIEDRFNLEEGMGATIELTGAVADGMMGLGFIYTNKESLSVGMGVMLNDLIGSGKSPNELLENLKTHPMVKPLVAGGEIKEYMGHLIPEGGLEAIPKLYTDGLMVIGDAAGLVNAMHREGSNLAMLSGKFAAETVLEARSEKDFSARMMSRYEKRLMESVIGADLKKYRRAPRFFESSPHLFSLYPQLLNDAAAEFITVDGVPKRQKQWKIIGMARQRRSLLGMARDLWGAWRSLP